MSFRQLKQHDEPAVSVADTQIFNYISNQQWLSGYRLAHKQMTPTFSGCINLGLCYLRIKNYGQAEHWFLKGLDLLKGSMDVQAPLLDEIELSLLQAEVQDKTYLRPINPNQRLTIALDKLNIQLLLFDVYLATDNQQALHRVIASLERYGFEHVNKVKKGLDDGR